MQFYEAQRSLYTVISIALYSCTVHLFVLKYFVQRRHTVWMFEHCASLLSAQQQRQNIKRIIYSVRITRDSTARSACLSVCSHKAGGK